MLGAQSGADYDEDDGRRADADMSLAELHATGSGSPGSEEEMPGEAADEWVAKSR